MAFLSARSLEHLVELGDENRRSETRCLSKKAYMNFSLFEIFALGELLYAF